jgi:allophanate hydrolase
MSGLPLNYQLTELGAKLVGEARTAPVYRMYDLGPKPSLVRQTENEPGFEIGLEIWELPLEKVGDFLQYALGFWCCAGNFLAILFDYD